MTKRLLTLVAMLCIALPTMAQSSKIVAKVIDAETKEGIIGAIMEVVNPVTDKRYHSVSGAMGAVTVSGIQPGDYNVNITFIGYATYSQGIKVEGSALNLGTIELKSEAVAIEAVVKEVQALRTSQNGDTVAYNAAAFKVAADADVEGLLKKMPGITISNGSVEAQGEQVKKIFVDGKEFFGEDVSTALNSLPAQAVDRIEVFNKLSDNAEFSGMDDGEGYKAINIVTHENMRQGVFGKVYAGYGYQPDTEGGAPDFNFQNDSYYEPTIDGVTSHHKYNFGGNVNIFHGSSRVSIIGMLNNVNQQNFSFEDILGVTGGGGGGMGHGRGVGGYMVRPQSGVARVGSIGVQYSDAWGKGDKVKLNGSYFYNDTKTKNKSYLQKWYEMPSPADYLEQEGESETHNFNHRLNARLDWTINKNMSLMSRTNFSFQGNDPYSQQYGEMTGESAELKDLPYEMLYNGSTASSRAFRFSEFLQYRVKLGKDGRTITVDGRYSIRNTPKSETNSYSTLSTMADPETGEVKPVLRYVSSFAPQTQTDVSANLTYTEPVAKNAQVSLQYRFDFEDQDINKDAYVVPDNSYNIADLVPDKSLSSYTDSRNTEHRVGPGFRWAKARNTFIANVYYQHSILDGLVKDERIKRGYDHITYFVMGNIAFNPQNSIRVFINSYTQNPDVRNLQNIFDVSNAQYISKGNPNLKSAYNHRINFHYVRSNIEKGRTFMWMFSGNITQDYVGQSIVYNPETITIDGAEYNPLQYSTYENMNGSTSLRTNISYGFPIAPIKCNLNLMAGYSWTRTPSMIDNQLNITSTMGYDAMFSLGSNISENVDFTIQWNGAYYDAKQSLSAGLKNSYFNHTASGTLKWVFWKGFTLTAAVNYNQYVGFTDKYNEDYLICNVYLGKKLFKNQQGEVLIGVNDLLNENTAFARSVGSGYTQNMWNSTVGRYFTIQFNYNLRFFGKKGSKDISKYDGMGGMSKMPGGMPPFAGGRPPMMHPH